jgi:hypothetical protein
MNYPAVRDSLGLDHAIAPPVFDGTALETIVSSVMARADAELIYSFDQGGSKVVGLTVYGVFEVAREMNQRGLSRIAISDREPTVIDTDEYVEVRVYAHDALSGGGAWGIKREAKWNGTKPTGHSVERALSKAQRNAVNRIIPAHLAKAVIAARVGALRGKGRPVVTEDTTSAAQLTAATRAQLGGATKTEAQDQPAPQGDQPRATEAQVKAMYVIARNERQYEPAEFETRCMEVFGGLPNELTKREASEVIDRLKAGTI